MFIKTITVFNMGWEKLLIEGVRMGETYLKTYLKMYILMWGWLHGQTHMLYINILCYVNIN